MYHAAITGEYPNEEARQFAILDQIGERYGKLPSEVYERMTALDYGVFKQVNRIEAARQKAQGGQ